MSNAAFSLKDLKLLDIIAGSSEVSQRVLAEKAGLSLGMVNLLLRRMALTGYIKVATMDRRKMSYALTPKGLAEKTKRSYTCFLRTLRVYEQYRKQINQVIDQQIQRGHKFFAVVGEGDLADMVKVILKDKGEILKFQGFTPPDLPQPRGGHVILNCCLEGGKPLAGISVLEEILESNAHIPKGELHELA